MKQKKRNYCKLVLPPRSARKDRISSETMYIEKKEKETKLFDKLFVTEALFGRGVTPRNMNQDKQKGPGREATPRLSLWMGQVT